MYFNIKCIGKLLGPTNEFERSLVFETGEFERSKFDCTCGMFKPTHMILVLILYAISKGSEETEHGHNFARTCVV